MIGRPSGISRALVLFAHPCAESFSAALHTRVLDTLSARNCEVDDCDLNAEKFAPILTAAERRGYHDEGTNTAAVADYVDRLRAADALVMVFPVWHFGYPAILKGFFDRIFLPGVSFSLVGGSVTPNLTQIRRLAAVTTYGATRFRAVLAGDPPRKGVTRVIRHVCQPERTRYLALYDMNRASDAARGAFLDRVEQKMEVL